jgi:acetyl esterase/lipase
VTDIAPPHAAPRGFRLPGPVDLLNHTARLHGVTVERGVAYGWHGRHRLDLYRPAPVGGRPAPRRRAPVVVFFYGGSWQSGARVDYRFVAAAFARAGYVVVVPDYRLYPQVRFPGFIEDSALATAWVLREIEPFGGDPGQVFLAGHSAGAYNAMMLALAPDYLVAEGEHPSRLAGVIGIAGPYDFLPLRNPVHKTIFGAAGALELTQPIYFAAEHGTPGVIGAPLAPGAVRAGAPPVLLLTGGADRVVLPRNTAALAARLRAAGTAVETRIYPGLGHVDILLALLPWMAWRAPVKRDCLGFLAACRAGDFAEDRSGIPANMAG